MRVRARGDRRALPGPGDRGQGDTGGLAGQRQGSVQRHTDVAGGSRTLEELRRNWGGRRDKELSAKQPPRQQKSETKAADVEPRKKCGRC